MIKDLSIEDFSFSFKDFIRKENEHLSRFFFICSFLIVFGLILMPLILLMIIPWIVDAPNNRGSIKNRSLSDDSDDLSSIIDDEENDEVEEIASF